MTNPLIDNQRQTDHRPRAGRVWRDRAACRDVAVDADLFFPAAESGPVRDAQVAAAKAVCARCPVRAECLTEALFMWISARRKGCDQGRRVRDMSVTPGDASAARVGRWRSSMNTAVATETGRRVRTRWMAPLVKDTDATDVHDGPIDAWNRTSRTSRTGLGEIHITLLRIPHGIAGGLTEHERRRLRRDHPRTGAAVRVVDEVLTDGPPPGMTARERAGVGRMLLATGRSTRQVAGDCGVCPRTAERWATTSPTSTGPTSTGPTSTGPTSTGPTSTGPTSTGPTSTGPTSTGPTSTSGMSGGAGEGSRGGHRAPLRISTAQHAQAGTRAPEGHRG